MTVTVNRVWLVLLYTQAMILGVTVYGNAPPLSFISVEVHKAICAFGIVWWFVAATYHSVKWAIALVRYSNRETFMHD